MAESVLVLVAGALRYFRRRRRLTALTGVSGAIGVGLIAFGLQKVVSNFVSGVIHLLDKSIKPVTPYRSKAPFGGIREMRGRFDLGGDARRPRIS
ncbi:hypothetical protein ACFSQT_19645 [Mesorhizobium calcicola]|uniref:MacB-like periplasmic core domain-containing protein n=1 Tax=Mesorhizobium calcicola TaxID=1300310 RepID=A0ABW4WEZ8_9HYPH